jgi:ATP-dependent RNA helicase DDX1
MEKYLRSVTEDSNRFMDKYTCRVLAGMRTMEERQKSLKDFKEGEVRILIATDVAARGIDIRELPFVINVTLPDRPELYAHRSGRVGRADRMGLSISLVSIVDERVWFCRKPNKPPCSDTRDFEKGGNCIGYKEPEFYAQILKLLQDNTVEATSMKFPELEIPENVRKIMDGGGYGDTLSGDSDSLLGVKAVQDKIKLVQETESALQEGFWRLRSRVLVQPIPNVKATLESPCIYSHLK